MRPKFGIAYGIGISIGADFFSETETFFPSFPNFFLIFGEIQVGFRGPFMMKKKYLMLLVTRFFL